MINFIVVGKCKRVTGAVLQAIHSFTDAKCLVIGGPETRIFRWSALCKRQKTIALDGSCDERFVAAVRAASARAPHAILVPADCDAIRLVNRVRARLPVAATPIPDAATLDMFDNKWRFHQFCTRHGLPVPATRLFASKAALDYDALAADLGVPFMVKPLDRAGSTGVHTVRDRADFDTSILRNAAYDYGPLIAQRHIEGVDIDISFLARAGRICAYAVQRAEPSQIVFCAHAGLEDLAVRLCAASAYHGVMHVDARVDAATGQVLLIESNPRFWASLTASAWCGLNFVAESLVPTVSSPGVRRLTAGAASTRHPLIRPSSWPRLMADPSAHGRLLRALAFDPPAFAAFIAEFPLACQRYAARRAGSAWRGRRSDRAGARADRPA